MRSMVRRSSEPEAFTYVLFKVCYALNVADAQRAWLHVGRSKIVKFSFIVLYRLAPLDLRQVLHGLLLGVVLLDGLALDAYELEQLVLGEPRLASADAPGHGVYNISD